MPEIVEFPFKLTKTDSAYLHGAFMEGQTQLNLLKLPAIGKTAIPIPVQGICRIQPLQIEFNIETKRYEKTGFRKYSFGTIIAGSYGPSITEITTSSHRTYMLPCEIEPKPKPEKPRDSYLIGSDMIFEWRADGFAIHFKR